jgi:sigma-E factor negative regulatory protein RseC
MLAEGVVVRLEETRAYVKIRRPEGCGRCHEEGGCGGVVQEESRCQEFLVDNDIGAKAGQRVSVEVPEGAALKAVLLAYGAPLGAMIAGSSVAFICWHSDLSASIGAAVGLACGVFAVYGLRGSEFVRNTRPRVVAVVTRPDSA